MIQNAKSAEEVRKTLRLQGLTISQWADNHGFKVRTVEAILRGERKAHFGIGRSIAVALGMKQAGG